MTLRRRVIEPHVIVIHASATTPDMDIGREEIAEWHAARGFSTVGYHWIIRRNGTIEAGRPPWAIGAHTKGVNNGLGVCMVGGIDKSGDEDSNFTKEQWAALESLILGLTTAYPSITVAGHRDFAPKACPCFDVRAWWYGR